MEVVRSLHPISSCPQCGGAMPPAAATGRMRVYCSSACRKAAYEARRARRPDATRIQVLEVPVVERHDIAECVEAVKASPVACRNVLLHLAKLLESGDLHRDPKWARTITTAHALGAAIALRGEQQARQPRPVPRWPR